MRQGILAALLVVCGAYVLVQPFEFSPGLCLSRWGGLSIVSIQNCSFNSPDAVPFIAGATLGIISIVAGLWSVATRLK